MYLITLSYFVFIYILPFLQCNIYCFPFCIHTKLVVKKSWIGINKVNLRTPLFTLTMVSQVISAAARWQVKCYQVKDVAAHLDHEAVQSCRVSVQDLQQLTSPGCFGSQSPDGPLHVRAMRALTQYDQVLTMHAPRCLKHSGEKIRVKWSVPMLTNGFFLNVSIIT